MVRKPMQLSMVLALSIQSIILAFVIVLLFQCIAALLNPANGMRMSVKWGLIAQAMAMFSFLTVSATTALAIQSVCYIDDREFPGDDENPPGPLGYNPPNANAYLIVYDLGFT